MLRRMRDPLRAAAADQNSTKIKMVVLFLYFAGTIAAIRIWMIIIRSENVLYETGGALATTLALYSLYWYTSRQFTQCRGVQRQVPSPLPSPETLEQTEARELRERLEQAYGSGVHTFLLGGPGLTVSTIDALLPHSTHEKGHPVRSSCRDLEKNSTTLSAPMEAEDCFECSVCLAGYTEGDDLTSLPCGHAYHRECITSWLLSRNLCPMCKQQPIQLADLTAALDNATPASSAVASALGHDQDLSGASDAYSQDARPVEGISGTLRVVAAADTYFSYVSALGEGLQQMLRTVGRRSSRRTSVIPIGAIGSDRSVSHSGIFSGSVLASSAHASSAHASSADGTSSQFLGSEEGGDLEAQVVNARPELAGFRPLSISDIRGIHSP